MEDNEIKIEEVKNKKNSSKGVLIAVLVIVLAAVVFAGWKLGEKRLNNSARR